MLTFIVLTVGIAIFLFFMLRKKSCVLYLRKLVLPLLISLFILCLILFSETAVSSARKGLSLWFDVVFPSLFPFFVASEILSMTGFTRVIGVLLEPVMRPLFNVPGCGSFAFAMGITSGYPVGAKITAAMRDEKLLTRVEAERLLAFTNNSGPLFIVGAVSVGMLGKPEMGIFLLVCHILACITVGLVFRFYKRNSRGTPANYHNLLPRFRKELAAMRKNLTSNIGGVLGDAVKNSIATLLSIGGFIILFSVIINLLLKMGLIDFLSGAAALALAPMGVGHELITPLISGFFEITTGASMACGANAELGSRLTAVSMVIGWAGLSVHSQVYSIISKTDISIKPYLAGKFLQGAVAGLYTFVGIKTAGLLSFDYKPAFNQFSTPALMKWGDYVILSGKNLLLCISLLLVCTGVALLWLRIGRTQARRS